MKFDAVQIARATQGVLHENGAPGKVCTDTRALQPGDWFLAIVGERFDGHRFLEDAKQAGVAGCIISNDPPKDWTLGCVQVSDTTIALQDLGRFARQQFTGALVSLTGTAGKTTTRALIACALAHQFDVHQTKGNLNNHLGVPMTLVDMPKECTAIVLEMGTSSPGEIQFLAELATPDLRIVLNVGEGHLEELGGLEGVAHEKGALIRTAGPKDIVLKNIDDPRVLEMSVPDGVRCISWGETRGATIRMRHAVVDAETMQTRASYDTPQGSVTVNYSVPGLHIAHNGACALAVAHALGVSMDEASQGLQEYAPVGMRQRIETIGDGIVAINDAYNANPVSMRAALETLGALSGRRFAILGDMLELGVEEHAFHREILDFGTHLPIEQFILVGARFQSVMPKSSRIHWFATPEAAAHFLSPMIQTGDTLLFKGSRGSRVERILQLLQESTLS